MEKPLDFKLSQTGLALLFGVYFLVLVFPCRTKWHHCHAGKANLI